MSTLPPSTGAARPRLPTRVPADFDHRLAARRGAWQGQARWTWSVQQGRFRSELQVDAPQALNWVSTGSLDEHGVAPERFLSQPSRGGARAVNFQRDTGLVSYSGPTGQVALLPGAQDRLSWLVQLLALVQGHPEGAPVPSRWPIWVAGPQGDGADWWFELTVTPTAQGPCWHLRRRAEQRYEVQVQAWVLGASPARLAHLVMGAAGGRQAPWELWDPTLGPLCGPSP